MKQTSKAEKERFAAEFQEDQNPTNRVIQFYLFRYSMFICGVCGVNPAIRIVCMVVFFLTHVPVIKRKLFK